MSNASKNLACEEFYKEYLTLSDTKKENFSRLCNKLLNENFIYFSQTDQRDRNDYYEILTLKHVIENYFTMLDYDLTHIDTYKIFFLKTTADRYRLKLKKLETVILLVLRLLYHKGSLNVSSSSDIQTTVGELNQEINKTGIFPNILTKTDFLNALKTLKRHKLINYNFTELNEDNVILIYPTILYVVKIENIDAINNKIQSYKNVKDEEEETDEID